MTDPIELSRDLVQCASVTPADEGAQDVLIAALEPLGFAVHDVTRGAIRNTFFRLGDSGPHFCFCGHTDVVPPGDEAAWTHPPFGGVIGDGKLYGRGTADMKANIACFVAAAARFLDSGAAFDGSISLLITGDEEAEAVDGTVKVLAWMAENGHTPDAALVGEPTNPESMGDELKIGRRGSLTGRLSVSGVQGHVAYPDLADNPLPRLVSLLDALAGHEFDTGSDFFPVTNLELTTIDTGNTADNVIPAAAQASFNVRFNDHWTAATLEREIRAVLDRIGLGYTLSCASNAESFITKPGPLTDIVAGAVTDITGRSPALSTGGGTSDARFVAPYCPVVECGLVNRTIHQIDEHAAVSDIETLTQIYLRVLERFFAAS